MVQLQDWHTTTNERMESLERNLVQHFVVLGTPYCMPLHKLEMTGSLLSAVSTSVNVLNKVPFYPIGRLPPMFLIESDARIICAPI